LSVHAARIPILVRIVREDTGRGRRLALHTK
jgi:hypothetical protein